MNNLTICKNSLEEITLVTFKEAIFLALKNEQGVILFNSLNSKVSIISYCNEVELLIKDAKGTTLFHGRYNINLGINFVAIQYYKIFQYCKHEILNEIKDVSDFRSVKIPEGCSLEQGFDMLRAHQNGLSLELTGEIKDPIAQSVLSN